MVFQVQKWCDLCSRSQMLATSINKQNRWKCGLSEETCPWKQKNHSPWSCLHAFWKTIGTHIVLPPNLCTACWVSSMRLKTTLLALSRQASKRPTIILKEIQVYCTTQTPSNHHLGRIAHHLHIQKRWDKFIRMWWVCSLVLWQSNKLYIYVAQRQR